MHKLLNFEVQIFSMSGFFDLQDYGLYFEHEFRHRWLRPSLLYDKLKKFRQEPALRFSAAGTSTEGRELPVVQWGRGPTHILLWTQMHGNEPTATMALVDLLNFLTSHDKYDEIREKWEHHLTLSMVMMLNPDGAERNTRQNALSIDLNRDAIARQTAEMRSFMKLADDFRPHWAFNLHDQRNIFSAGDTGYPATISFLAPSADAERNLTGAREKSMQLIACLAAVVEEYLPRHTGRYTDEHYPRALGDYFQRQGVPCVLIESGAFYEDEFRDQARKLNFLSLLEAFELIASGRFAEGIVDEYLAIPQNHTNMLDLIVRNCSLRWGDQQSRADLGFLYREEIDPANNALQKILILKEVGDLSFSFGLEEEEGGLIQLQNNPLPLEQPADFTVIRTDGSDIIFNKGRRQ